MSRPLNLINASGGAERPRTADRAIAIWLLGCAAMIFAMVVVGGITRLTESGLSITEWRPLSGAVPPMSEAEWARLFDQYRQIPEYRADHPEMTIVSFKTIFWWEYVHRLWGRLIGVAFALPFLYFILRGRIARPLVPRLAAMLALGAAQGGLGWYLVKSGLADRIDVSQYRLVAHLMLALAIYASMLWTALDLLRPAAPPVPRRRSVPWRGHLLVVAGLVVMTIVFGGFVAGLDAGRIYNTFPLMGGRVMPADALAFEPAWINPFENPSMAQFIHRILAIVTVCAALWLWARVRSSRNRDLPSGTIAAIDLLALIAMAQASLGIATLVLVVPIPLAAAHQAGAVALLSLVIWPLHATRGAG